MRRGCLFLALVLLARPAFAAGDRAGLERRAEHGDVQAMVKLGYMLGMASPAGRRDERGAIAWLTRAAQHGDARAAMELGAYLGQPLGVKLGYKPKDGFPWLLKSAQLGFGPAFAAVGEGYATGERTRRDPVEAARWLERSLAAGYLASGAELSDLYGPRGAAGADPEKQLMWALVTAALHARRWPSYLEDNPVERTRLARLRLAATTAQTQRAEGASQRWMAAHPPPARKGPR